MVSLDLTFSIFSLYYICMYIDKAIKLIRQCETELRSLLAAAADAGDYEKVLKLTSWAQQLAALVASADGSTMLRKPAITTPVSSAKRAAKGKDYPRFGRRGESLVKVGWSKREKNEYEHKAPKRAVDLLVSALVRTGINGRIFQANDILPLADPDEGTEIPVYQVYLSLAWLRGLGLVDQHGRQGYSVTKPKELMATVEGAWHSLGTI